MTSSYYNITVRNNSSNTQYFYVFQKRATFQPPVSNSLILSGSLGCQTVGSYQSTGAQISFALSAQTYVGAVSTASAPPPSTQTMSFFAARVRSIPPTSTKAVWPIDLTTASGSTASNVTNLTVSPLGLSQPVNKPGIPVGAFGVSVPPYVPTPTPQLYCGVATVNAEGSVFLSSFIAPQPNNTMTCAPEAIYFVRTGYMADGDIVPYDETNAAQCDFTTGYTRITVTYNPDGTFSTTNGP